jgi:hypothetical protein
MTSVTSNSATESIIGANVTLSGLLFRGLDASGAAEFGPGSLSIFNSTGTFLTADYANAILFSDSLTHNSVVYGDLTSISLSFAQPSRYLDELTQDLATIPNPTYSFSTDANLSDLTNGFLTDGSVSVSDCSIGGGVSSAPEPSSLILFAIGGVALMGYGWRRAGGRSHRVGESPDPTSDEGR